MPLKVPFRQGYISTFYAFKCGAPYIMGFSTLSSGGNLPAPPQCAEHHWLFEESIHTSNLHKLPRWVDPFSIVDALSSQSFYVAKITDDLFGTGPRIVDNTRVSV